MNRLYQAAANLRSLLLCQKKSADRMDPVVRNVLFETQVELQDEIADIQSAVDDAQLALKEAQEKERIIETRYRFYQKKLQDNNTHNDEHREALERVKMAHKDLLVQCEQMRRNVKILEEKRDRLLKMNTGCWEVLEPTDATHQRVADVEDGGQ